MYKVCGEPQLPEAPVLAPAEPTRPQYQLQTSSAGGWGTPRPWQAQAARAEPTNSARNIARPKYETSFFKRSMPFVTLCPDKAGRSVSVDTYITNLYLKIPESEVSLEGILAAASPKVDLPVEQLDSSFLPVTGADKGDLSPHPCCAGTIINFFSDIEFWKTPS